MGVPSFFSWVVRQYPLCLYDFDQIHKVDFLYLDLNQVIYKTAINPNVKFSDLLRNRDLTSIFIDIFNYVDAIISKVDPQKLVFLAFDGVAPRAKMNQQRMRRFQSGKAYSQALDELSDLGLQNQNESYKVSQFTPGTEFMHELNKHMKFYIERKFNEEWKDLKVIFSGTDVPGEGEHKIMEYIRNLKKQQNFNKDWSHFIYGADADLIMLGLSTGLEQIAIIREVMVFNKNQIQVAASRAKQKNQFQIINLKILREYFDLEYSSLKWKIQYDLQKVINDFIMLCFLVGNDFLPRVYCFDIQHGTFEQLIILFKQHLEQCDSYINDRGNINWETLTQLFSRLNEFENLALENRKNELKKILSKEKNLDAVYSQYCNMELETIESIQSSSQQNQQKKLFYSEKCKIDMNKEISIKEINSMVQKYTEGIQFILKYYYQGIPSWQWYYSFYYAPLCSDIFFYLLKKDTQKHFDFQLSKPYPPFKQLICVLPREAIDLIPKEYQHLILNADSPLQQFYPQEFEVDPYGAIFEFHYIIKLPHIDQDLVDKCYEEVDISGMDESVKERNQIRSEQLYEPSYEENGIIKSIMPQIICDFTCKFKRRDYKQQEIELSQEASGTRYPFLHQIELVREKCTNRQIYVDEQNDKLIDKIRGSHKLYGYCNYPNPYFGEIIFAITRDELVLCRNYSIGSIELLMEMSYSKKCHSECYKELKEKAKNRIKDKKMRGKFSTIIYVRQYMELLRRSNGNVTYNKQSYFEDFFPIQFVSLIQKVDLQYYYVKQKRKVLDEFPIGSKVVVYTNNYLNGCLGLVEEVYDDLEIRVRCDKQPISQKIDVSKMEYKFISIKKVANQLKLNLDVLLYVLGSVVIRRNNDRQDVGFNVINKKRNMLVSELVRLPLAQSDLEGAEKFKQFEYIELYEPFIQDIKEYQQLFPELFTFLSSKKQYELYSLYEIKESEILNDNKKLSQIYVWMLQLQSSFYSLNNAASSILYNDQVQEINNKLTKKYQFKRINTVISINVGLVYLPEDIFIPPFLRDHPKFHQLGDRVISIRKSNFGSCGTIIGIVDQDKDIWVQVLWDEPRIGYSDLGGRCQKLKGQMVRFIEVYNLNQQWHNCLASRNEGLEKKGWSYVTQLYIPQFKQK